jgi:hypothetical protein
MVKVSVLFVISEAVWINYAPASGMFFSAVVWRRSGANAPAAVWCYRLPELASMASVDLAPRVGVVGRSSKVVAGHRHSLDDPSGKEIG